MLPEQKMSHDDNNPPAPFLLSNNQMESDLGDVIGQLFVELLLDAPSLGQVMIDLWFNSYLKVLQVGKKTTGTTTRSTTETTQASSTTTTIVRTTVIIKTFDDEILPGPQTNNNKNTSPLMVLQTLTSSPRIKESLLLDLIFAGGLPNLRELYLNGSYDHQRDQKEEQKEKKKCRAKMMKWLKDDTTNEKGDFGQILAKMPHLTSITIEKDDEDDEDDKSQGQPPLPLFDRTVQPFTLPELKKFILLSNGVSYQSMINLCQNAHFPNLVDLEHSQIWIDKQVESTSKPTPGYKVKKTFVSCTCKDPHLVDENTQRHDEMGKLLVKWIEMMPKVCNYLKVCHVNDYKIEFFKHFANSSVLSRHSAIKFDPIEESCGQNIENCNVIITSPHLINVKKVKLSGLTTSDQSEQMLSLLLNQSWVNNLTSLTLNYTNLSDNRNIATLLSESTNLTNLIKFRFDGKLKEDEVKSILHSPIMSKVTSLSLSFPPHLWSQIITQSPYLSQLEEFDPQSSICQLTLEIMVDFLTIIVQSNLKLKIPSLYLDIPLTGCDDTTTILKLLSIPNLSTLLPYFLFTNHRLSQESLLAIASYGTDALNIHKLDLSGHTIVGIDDKIIEKLLSNPNWSNLTELSLNGCNLGDHHLELLSNCPHLNKLTSLELNGNNITDKGLKTLAQGQYWTQLKTLRLQTNKLTSIAIKSLCQSPYISNLSSLDVTDNSLLEALEVGCLWEDDTMLMAPGSTFHISVRFNVDYWVQSFIRTNKDRISFYFSIHNYY